jgi:hypothetical protein
MTTKAENDSALVAEVRLLRAQVASMAEEREQTRAEVAQLRQAVRVSTGREVAQADHTVHRADTFTRWEDLLPEHDPAFVEAFTRFGVGSDEARSALAAARRRIASLKNNVPGRQSDFERLDRARNAVMVDVPAGSTVTRDPETGQVHVAAQAGLTCPSGHGGHADNAQFCGVCGGPVGSVPQLGHNWQDEIPEAERSLRRERLQAEGVI